MDSKGAAINYYAYVASETYPFVQPYFYGGTTTCNVIEGTIVDNKFVPKDGSKKYCQNDADLIHQNVYDPTKSGGLFTFSVALFGTRPISIHSHLENRHTTTDPTIGSVRKGYFLNRQHFFGTAPLNSLAKHMVF